MGTRYEVEWKDRAINFVADICARDPELGSELAKWTDIVERHLIRHADTTGKDFVDHRRYEDFPFGIKFVVLEESKTVEVLDLYTVLRVA